MSILFAHTLDVKKARYVHQGENVTKHNSSRTRLPMLLSGVATAALLLSGCTGNDAEENDAAGAADDSAVQAGSCGSIPEMAPNDPNTLLGEMSEEVQAAYQGYPYEVKKSQWQDWKPDHDGPYTAAMVTDPPTNPFQVALYESMRNTLAENDVELIAEYAPASHADVPQQLQQFEEAISQNPDIIFFLPLAPDSTLDALASAADAGIPVVIFQVPVDSEHAVSVSLNPVLQAAETGASVFSSMGGEGAVLRVLGVPGNSTDTFATMGYDAALEQCPDITVAGEVTGTFEPGTAQAETLNFLSSNPTPVTGVVQSGTMGVGVLQAFLDSGRDPVPIADIGATQGFVSWAIQNPEYPYTGSVSPATRMGDVYANVGIRMLNGDGPKVNQMVTAAQILDSENIGELGDDSWEITDQTLFDGEPEAFFPEEHLDELFTN